jgi:hypothetical protein
MNVWHVTLIARLAIVVLLLVALLVLLLLIFIMEYVSPTVLPLTM